MAILFIIILVVIIMVWYVSYINKPTASYKQTQQEAAGLTAELSKT